MSHRTQYPVRFVSCALVFAGALFVESASAAPVKVACTGTSAMQGLGSTTGHHVPDELGRALGSGYDVRNFAIDGATAIQSISSSYAATSQMKAALAFNPDIVLFWFGGNDSFQATWDAHKAEFGPDYTSLVRTFQALPSHPKTFLVRLWVFVDMPVQRTVIDKEILPIIDQMAPATGSFLIDYRKAFEMHPEYFPDGMHPNDAGTLAIGKFFASSVTMSLESLGDGGTLADGGLDLDGSGIDERGDAGFAGSSVDDAAPVIEASAEPATSGVGGSRGGAGGSGNVVAGGSGGISTMAGSAGNVEPAAAAGSDAGGCRMSQKGGSGVEGFVFLAWMGLRHARRRRATMRRGQGSST